MAEIAFDPSTNFVRSAPSSLSTPGMYADGFVGQIHRNADSSPDDSNSPDTHDLFQGASISHASCSETVITFPSYSIGVTLITPEVIPYQPPSLRLEHRPPILTLSRA